jgi:hypothetical protein
MVSTWPNNLKVVIPFDKLEAPICIEIENAHTRREDFHQPQIHVESEIVKKHKNSFFFKFSCKK